MEKFQESQILTSSHSQKSIKIITLRLVVIFLCLIVFFPQLKIYYLFIIYIYPGFPLISLKPISQFGVFWEAISWAVIHSKVPEYNWIHFTLGIFLSVDSSHIPLRSSSREEESACIDYLTFLNWFINTSHVQLFATSWTVAGQAPLFMGFPKEEYWSWLPFPTPGDLPHQRIEPSSLASPALAGGFFINLI